MQTLVPIKRPFWNITRPLSTSSCSFGPKTCEVPMTHRITRYPLKSTSRQSTVGSAPLVSGL